MPVPLYLRRVQVTASAKGADEGLDFSNFRIKFSVQQSTLEAPNTADVRIYNLSDQTISILQKGGEFSRVRILAGYDGNFGLLFDGTVVQTRAGRENPTDTYFDFVCADGDIAYNYAVVNQSLAAGHSAQDVLDAVSRSMQPHGVSMGYAPPLSGQVSPRGRTLYGMSRTYMRDLAKTNNATWSIQNGQLILIPNGQAIPDTQAIVLNADTGMVGLPVQTQLGIVVRSLLNPQIKIGRRLQINNKSVQKTRIDTSYTGAPNNGFLPRVADDGFYRAIVVDHRGDTRDNDYYSEVICIALGDPLTPALMQRGVNA